MWQKGKKAWETEAALSAFMKEPEGQWAGTGETARDSERGAKRADLMSRRVVPGAVLAYALHTRDAGSAALSQGPALCGRQPLSHPWPHLLEARKILCVAKGQSGPF